MGHKGTPHTQGINARVSAGDRMTGNRRSQNAVGYAGGMQLPSTRMAEKSKGLHPIDRTKQQLGTVVRYG